MSDRPEERTEPRMMDFEHWNQHREERLREVEQNRVATASWVARKRRARTWAPRWEVKRIAGRLL